MSEIKVGDVVRLKSGGPRMTVEEIRQDQRIVCIWFSSEGRLELFNRTDISPEALEKEEK